MHPNRMVYAHDPYAQQFHQERCREELRLYESYCNERKRMGYHTEPPRFNEFGQVMNLPHHLAKLLKFPRHLENPQQYYEPNTGYYTQVPNQNYLRQQVPQPPPPQEQNDTFSLCYTLSNDLNSPARQIFDSFKHYALVPGNMVPSHVIFVFEKPSNLHYRSPASADLMRRDAGVGDYSVVRYDVETQTEWGDKEQPPSVTDNAQQRRNNPIITREPTTSNISEPDAPEFNMAVWKVAQWLHMTKSLGDVFNGSEDTEKHAMSLPPPKVMQNICQPLPPFLPEKQQQKWKLDAKAFEPAKKLKVEVATTATAKPKTKAASCGTDEPKEEKKGGSSTKRVLATSVGAKGREQPMNSIFLKHFFLQTYLF